MADKYDVLKLCNQLCFPLYACAKGVVKMYKPFLDKINLTYTQYITMMVMWEHRELNVKTLGEYLYLDSGTLTPVLKKLEQKNYITRTRDKEDERNLLVSITPSGEALKDEAVEIPMKLVNCVNLDQKDLIDLHRILHKLLGTMNQES